MKEKIISLFRIFTPLILGSIIGLLISNNIDYPILTKPPLAPPKILFPIIWSIIYLLLGISYYLYSKQENNNSTEIIIYYLQLFLNIMWSIIFFIWKLRLFSVLWILLLLITIIIMLKQMYNKNKLSSYLNIPYLIWTIFATYLTIGIYILN